MNIPELREPSNIEGTYKKQHVRGNASYSLGTVYIEDLPQDFDQNLEISATFDLCDSEIFSKVADARALNATATMYYGVFYGSEDSRTVVNRCTADLDGNGGAIKVTDDVFQDVSDACNAALSPIASPGEFHSCGGNEIYLKLNA